MSVLPRAVAAALCAVALALPAVAVAATPAPSVSSLSIHTSKPAGGVRIAVRGAHFTDVRAVRFGATAGTSLHVTSTVLSVVVPRHPVGAVHVTVVTSQGTSRTSSNDVFRFVGTPTVTSVSPDHGLSEPSTHVTVHGTQFYSVTGVLFGTKPGTHLTVLSPTSLTVDAPTVGASATVHVRVQTGFGTSALTSKGEFTYHGVPAPVTGLAATATKTSVTLSWTPSASASAQTVEVRRAAGTIPPSATSGTLLATLDQPHSDPSSAYLGRSVYRDLGLPASTKYAYALFVRDSTHAPSRAATAVATTAGVATLPPPVALFTSPWSRHPIAGECSSVSGFIGSLAGGDLVVGAHVANPDVASTPVAFQTRLVQTDALGSTTDLVTFDDVAGRSSTTADSADQNVFASPTGALVDGDSYALSLRTSDGTATSAATAPCSFGYDATPPTASVTGPTTGKVNKPMTFTLHGVDPQPTNKGKASGVDYLAYSAVSYDNGTKVRPRADGTATITVTPTVWGTNYLYVRAFDNAANRSASAVWEYYVANG